eukprot:1358679-Rhodomonas_salina.7
MCIRDRSCSGPRRDLLCSHRRCPMRHPAPEKRVSRSLKADRTRTDTPLTDSRPSRHCGCGSGHRSRACGRRRGLRLRSATSSVWTEAASPHSSASACRSCRMDRKHAHPSPVRHVVVWLAKPHGRLEHHDGIRVVGPEQLDSRRRLEKHVLIWVQQSHNLPAVNRHLRSPARRTVKNCSWVWSNVGPVWKR